MPMTYKQAAQAALDVQDACNLSGVLFSFAEVMQFLCDEAHAKNMGTKWKNHHPIVTLFVDKLADLNDRPSPWTEAYRDAYDECRKMVQDAS